MDPQLRSAFNADFSAEKYASLRQCVNQTERWPADFRICETPVFLTDDFTRDVVDAARRIVSETQKPEFVRHSAPAIPPSLAVPNEAAHPNFLVVDFGIC